ncbi:hypothetical protein AB0K43_18290 [Kitasatospora sp. NPDC049258]|uniref:hypothetical protein n=1 Tax=Kitasatospora sp. NPDC049258 TaxID=3155394 RepID=UPI00343E24B2
MSEQNPYGGQPPAQPYGAPPPPAQPYGAAPAQPYGDPSQPQQPWGSVPPQGGAPYPGYPGYPAQQQKKSRKTLWIVLGCVGGAILLGAGALAYVVYDVSSKTGTHKVVMPETFKGMKRNTTNPLAEQMQSSLQQEFGKGKDAWTPTAVSALYTDEASDQGKVIITFGGYGNVLAPNTQVSEFFDSFEKGASGQGTTFNGRSDFDPGPLGGKLTCEVMAAESETDSLCVWADGSSVVGILTGQADSTAKPDLAAAAADARELRQVAEVPK